MEKVTKRIDWIDTLRGLAMYFVVWGHCQKNYNFIRKYIYHFHMPIFFFISGLTFGDSDKIPFKVFAKKKFKSLVIPYFVMNIVCYILMVIMYKFGIIEEFSYLKNFFGIFYSNNKILPFPCGPGWFLLSLFLVNIIFYFLKKYSKTDFELGIACSICGILSYVNYLSEYQIRGPWHIESVFTGVVFFYIGYIFMKNIKELDFVFNSKSRMLLYGLFLGIFGFIGQYLNRRVSMDGSVYGSIFLFYFSSICTIIGLVLFVRLILNHSHIFKDIGKKTMFFLGYQFIIIDILLHFYPTLNNGHIYTFIMSIIIMILLYILSFFVYKFIPCIVGKFK